MPEITVTADQRERLRWVQRRLAEDVTYGHVRPCDALAYLFDCAESNGDLAEIGDPVPDGAGAPDSTAATPDSTAATPDSTDSTAATERVDDGVAAERVSEEESGPGRLKPTIHTSSSANTVRIATPTPNETSDTPDDAAAVPDDDEDPDDGETDGADEADDANDTDSEADDADDANDVDDTDPEADEHADVDPDAGEGTDETDETDDADGSEEAGEDTAERSGHAADTNAAADGDDAGAATLNSMMSLLDTHADKWREADAGEAKYEVDLPDGSTEGARTKDDVRAVLFKQYR